MNTAATTTPYGWRRRRLRFDARLNPKKSSLKLDAGTEVSFVPMEAIGELGGLDLSINKVLEDVYNGYTYFADFDVCVAKITPCFENGKGALAEGLTHGVGFGTTELHVVRSNEGLEPRFLFYISIAHDFRNMGAAEMLGAGGQKRVPEDFIKDWRPPLPLLETQQKIARFLDDKTGRIDALIEKKRELLDRLAEKRQALISYAVTKGLDPAALMKASGVDWLGEIPAHWNVKRLRFLLDGGTRNGLYKSKEQFSDDGVPFIQMGEAFRNVVFNGGTKDRVTTDSDELERWSLKEGDFLIARRSLVFEGSGKSVRIGSLDENHLFESSMIRIRPHDGRLSSKFLSYYFQSSVARAFFLAITKQVTISGIDSQQLKNIDVPVPGSSQEAADIVAFCASQEASINAVALKVHASIISLTEYRSAMITAAVTGKLEV